jgi:hypothetical protein
VHWRKISSSRNSLVLSDQVLFGAEMNPNVRAVLIGLSIVIIVFGFGIGAQYLW